MVLRGNSTIGYLNTKTINWCKCKIHHEKEDLKPIFKSPWPNGLSTAPILAERLRIARMSIEKEDIYQSMCLKHKLGLAPGCIAFFKFLMRNKIPYPIATAANLYNIDFYFEHLHLGAYFDKSKVVYSDGTIRSKPDPEIFIKALEITW